MKSTLAGRLVIILVLVLAGLTITYLLDDDSDMPGNLPRDAISTITEGANLFFARSPGTPEILYLSYDGRVWQQVPSPTTAPIVAVAAAPDRRATYAASEEALYVSRRGAGEWSRLDLPLDGAPVTLAMAPHAGTALYVAVDDGTVLRVDTESGTASRIEGTGLQSMINDLAVHPTGRLLAGTGEGLFHREIDGTSWEPVPALTAVDKLFHSPFRSDSFLAVTATEGLFRSTDGGVTWKPGNAGLRDSEMGSPTITALTAVPDLPGTFLAATAFQSADGQLRPDGIYLSSNGGTSWIPITTLGEEERHVTALLAERGPPIQSRAVIGDEVRRYQVGTERALAMLDDDDPAQRLDGAQLLSIAARPAHEAALLAHLQDEHPEIVYYAARGLGHIGSERGWNVLLGSLGDESLTPVRRALRITAEARGAEAVPRLRPYLEDRNPTVRANAAEALGLTGEPEASHALRPLLADSSPAVRARAAVALGMLHDQESAETLARLSREDTTGAVREAAGHAHQQLEQPILHGRTQQVAHASMELQHTPFDYLRRSTKAWLKALILSVIAAITTVILAARPIRRRIRKLKP